MQTLKLKPGEDKRLRQGHQWVYSNEVDVGATPLKGFDPGDEAVVVGSGGRGVGRALINPHALICARLISRDPERGIDAGLIAHRLREALALRERLYPGGCYRLIFGEADGLSGAVIDRFRDVVVVQLNTAGMERRRGAFVEALRATLEPRSIVLKHDSAARAGEALERYVEILGEEPGDRVPLSENGCEFLTPVKTGQKTGWFYDHRDSRARLAPWAPGARVLDVFSYVGGWGLTALHFGAAHVTALESSGAALEVLEDNARHQGVADRVAVEQGDAFAALEAHAEAGKRYDMVLIDPPALIKRRRDIKAGSRGYRKLAELGTRLTADDGLLAFGSCSLHFDRAMLVETLRRAARHVGRQARLLGMHGAGADHPAHPAIPETDYLKAAFVHLRRPDAGGAL